MVEKKPPLDTLDAIILMRETQNNHSIKQQAEGSAEVAEEARITGNKVLEKRAKNDQYVAEQALKLPNPEKSQEN